MPASYGDPNWSQAYRELMLGPTYQATLPKSNISYQPKKPSYAKPTTPTAYYNTPKIITSSASAPGNIEETVQTPQERSYQRIYREAIERAEQAKNERLSQISQYETRQKAQQNQLTGEALRQIYIQNEQALSRMPQQQAALGLSGGMSESAMIGQGAAYGEGRIGLENERAQQLADIAAQASTQRSDVLSGHYDNIGNLQLQGSLAQQAYAQQLEQREYERKLAEEQKQYEMQLSQQKASNSSTSKARSAAKTFAGYSNDELSTALKNPSTQKFIKDIEHNMPKGNIKDSRTGQIVTPEDQVAIALEMALKEGKLNEMQIIAIAKKYGIAIS